MTMQQRVTNLAQAIGADIKALRSVQPAKWLSLGADGVLDVQPTPDAIVYLNTVTAPNTILKSIRGGQAGQRLTLRLTTGLSIEHGSPIRLQNDLTLNATADQINANKIITLLCLSGTGTPGSANVWVEMGRNWISQGGIVESGENANGWWVRWADGTQMCRSKAIALTASPAIAAGAEKLFTGASSAPIWSFPKPFLYGAALSEHLTHSNNCVSALQGQSVGGTSGGPPSIFGYQSIAVRNISSTPISTLSVVASVWGRWK